MAKTDDLESARTTSGAGRVDICTPLGTIRGRYQLKAVCQSVVFVCVFAGYGCFHLYSTAWSGAPEGFDRPIRLLEEGDKTESVDDDAIFCDDLRVADPPWMSVFYAIGVLYMFLALAIACDEFFVPALEEMSSPRRLNLSMDVAGATLMAAGGSAPELFTSLFGTFQESEIGFGTIVGSAVFNVLFVIAMCSLLAKETLHLTWWPLFRDSLYYAIGLVVLAIFVGFNTPDVIELWEAIVLFIMYLGYILFMWKNAAIYKMLTGKVLEYPDEDDDGGDDDEKDKKPEEPTEQDKKPEEPTEPTREMMQQQGMNKSNSKGSVLSNMSAGHIAAHQQTPHFRWQGTFRAGILKLLKDPNSWMDTAGVGIVAKIAGDADYVFAQVDMDGNGHVDREELKQLFNLLECYVSPAELEEVFDQLDENKDGTVGIVVVRRASDWISNP
jgi:Ca2+/Na+ antiporter